jgi:hypothetical protein
MIMTSCQKEELPTLSSQSNSNSEMAKKSNMNSADQKNNNALSINDASLIIKSEEPIDKKSNNLTIATKKNLTQNFPVQPSNTTCTSEGCQAKQSKNGGLHHIKNQAKDGLQLNRIVKNVQPSDKPMLPASIKMSAKQN